MQSLMELLIVLSKETNNSVTDLMKMEFTDVHLLYLTLVKFNKEQQKQYEKQKQEQQDSMPVMPSMPSASSMKSMMSSLTSGYKMPH